VVVVASYGESSHPWLQKRITRKMRKQESEKSLEIVGSYKNVYLGIEEGRFNEAFANPKVESQLKELIIKYNVKKIFTHSIDDFHPDHAAISKFVLKLTARMKTVEVFTFNVWNPFNVRKTREPKMYVDITGTFDRKLAALKEFKSQRHVVATLFGGMFVSSMMNGLKSRTRYAEAFLKLK
jgi:LmbE family N-acetylglucosaminyl deacetylase